jgi:hypothetical protein
VHAYLEIVLQTVTDDNLVFDQLSDFLLDLRKWKRCVQGIVSGQHSCRRAAHLHFALKRR